MHDFCVNAIPELYIIVQEVGNVPYMYRKEANGKYYFSIYEINTGNTVFFVCLKYDIFFPSCSIIVRFLWLRCIDITKIIHKITSQR